MHLRERARRETVIHLRQPRRKSKGFLRFQKFFQCWYLYQIKIGKQEPVQIKEPEKVSFKERIEPKPVTNVSQRSIPNISVEEKKDVKEVKEVKQQNEEIQKVEEKKEITETKVTEEPKNDEKKEETK